MRLVADTLIRPAEGEAHTPQASWVWAGLWSLAAAWVLVNEVAVTPMDEIMWVSALLLGAVALTLPARRLLARAWERLEGRQRSRWVGLSLLSGLFLTLVIPVGLDTPFQLEVNATGDQDPESLGSAVWIVGLTRDGEPRSLSVLDLGEGWDRVDEGVFAVSRTEGQLGWVDEAARTASIVFSTGPHLGVAEVSLPRGTVQVDLYRPVPGEHRVGFELSPFHPYRLTLLVASTLALGMGLLAVSAWCISRAPVTESGRESTKSWEWLALAAPPAAVWTIHLFAFWPGVMTPDSMWQWSQILTGEFDNWHPAFHTMVEWLLTRPAETPAMVAAAQIVALSAVVGWGLASMRRIGLPAAAAWVVSFVVALWPANGITVITLWKDIPYAIGVLALGIILLREVDGRIPILGKPGGWLAVGVLASFVALFHHAGPLIAGGSLIALGLVRSWRLIFAPAVVAVVAFALVQGPLFAATVASTASPPHADAVVIHHLGAHVVGGTPLSDEEIRAVAQSPFLSDVSWYDCETATPLMIHPRFVTAEVREGFGDSLRLWWSLFIKAPQVDVSHNLCGSSFVWRIGRLPESYHYGTGLSWDAEGELSTIIDNPHGLRRAPVLPSLTHPLARAIDRSQGFDTAWVWWRGPLYLYALIFGAAIAALRARDWRYWLVVVPSGLVAFTLVVASPAQDFRYVYPVFLTGLLVAPYLALFSPPLRKSIGGSVNA